MTRARIDSLVAQATPPADRYERIAARYLWSTLAHFEGIAVLAAERGDGTETQLDDELVHQGVFTALARDCGGIEPPDPAARELIERLKASRGPASAIALNIVAESWLDTVFAVLGAPGWNAKLFRAIEADEARHVDDAWSMDIPPPEQIADVIAPIEAALVAIARSAAFVLPIRWLRGERCLSDMGTASAEAHRKVCAQLGIKAGAGIKRLEAMCRGLQMRNRPIRINTNGWRVSASRLSDAPIPMSTTYHVPWSDDRQPQIVDFTGPLARVLAEHPSLRDVMSGEQLYRHARPEILIRDRHRRGEVYSLHVHGQESITAIRRMRRRALREPYKPVPRLGDMRLILPPAAASVALTAIWPTGITGGQVPLIPTEGVPIVIGVAAPSNGQLALMITMDHRVYDPEHLALLGNGLVDQIIRGNNEW